MAAGIETTFSARTVPWHGLGTVVEGALSAADAIREAGLDWTVLSEPMFTNDGMEIPNYKANIRDKDRKVLGIVTDRYQIVQNQDAFDFTDSLVGGEVTYETAGSLFGGRKIWLLANLPKERILGDDVVPYLCFTNSHDGLGAVQAICTPVRVVCNNTLNLALSTAKRKWSTKHTGDITLKLSEAQHTLELAHTYMEELNKEAEKLANIDIKEDKVVKLLNELFPIEEDATDRRKANVQEMKDNFMVCMFAPDIAKFQGTAWQLVNAASDLATHVAPKRAASTYRENNFNRVLDGHAIIDKVYDLVKA